MIILNRLSILTRFLECRNACLIVSLVIVSLLLSSCITSSAIADDAKPQARVNTEAVKEMQQGTRYLVYYSLVSRPCIHYQKMYRRNPTPDEYYDYLTNNLPWEMPFGGLKNLDYVLNKNDGSAKLTYTDPKSQKSKTTYFNTDSVTGIKAEEISSNLGISIDEYKEYERTEYILEMLNGANWNYAADNHRLPKSIDELNSVLGLQLKSGTSLGDYGIELEFGVIDKSLKCNRNSVTITNTKNQGNTGRFLAEPPLIQGLVWPPS